METFYALLALKANDAELCLLLFSLICAGTKGWVNIRDAGYLRYHRAHYDIAVMTSVLRATNNRSITMVTRDPSRKLYTKPHPSNYRRGTVTPNYLGSTRRWTTLMIKNRIWICDVTWREMLKISITGASLKMINLWFQAHSPGTSELTY